MAPIVLSFIPGALYDVLLWAADVAKWEKPDYNNSPYYCSKQTIKHVLAVYKVVLGQGPYTWHHKVLLVAIVDIDGMQVNKTTKATPSKLPW